MAAHGRDRGRRRPGRRLVGPLSRRARFIALEGIDGAGKTTQLRLLAAALRQRGLEVETAREPGGTALGERLREVLLQADGIDVSPAAEVLLFAAARAQLVAEVIRPALAAGRWVLCDRFVDSSLAYQGLGRGVGVDAVWEANRVALAGCIPDRALVLDVPVGAALGRAALEDRIEAEGDGFQRAVADGYRELARRFPERVVLVPASGSVDEVHAAVMAKVEDLL